MPVDGEEGVTRSTLFNILPVERTQKCTRIKLDASTHFGTVVVVPMDALKESSRALYFNI